MTLDRDDVEVAKQWLKKPADWQDRETVRRYESEFSRWNNSRYAFSFMSGSAALSAIIHALGLGSNDEVILPAYTCVSVPIVLQRAGITPVFCDIELDTYGMDASLVEERITPRTRGVLLQHLYGLVCRDYEATLNLAKKHGLKIIEDCAQSAGATYKGVRVGNYGDAAFYSSDRSKVFNTVHGGIAVTGAGRIAEGLKRYYEEAGLPDEGYIKKALHTVVYDYYRCKHPRCRLTGDMAALRYKDKILPQMTDEQEEAVHHGLRMPAPLAAVGLNQLAKIDNYNGKRRENAAAWDRWCRENGYMPPLVIPDSVPIYMRYPVMVEPEKKKDLAWAMRELKVLPGTVFHRRVFKEGSYPNADKAIRQCINLPTLLS